ncbi:MAG: hypothetical protein IJX99_06965 [Clostridia bacterium]|nr:hypothetical protein [Clostridia bacterium]
MRGESKVVVTIGVEALTFKTASEVTDNGRVYYSGNDYYGINGKPSVAYSTLEEDYWLLDGKKKLLPETNFAVQPLISDVMTNSNCEFETKPKITITANTTDIEYNLIGLQMTFDELDYDFCSEFTVNAYMNDALVDTDTYANNMVECRYERGFDSFNKIEIIFNKMNKANRRLRLTKMFLGIGQTYTPNEIIDTKQKWTIDVLAREISDTDFQMTIDNSKNEYDADNPTGIAQYYQEKQPVQVTYMYEKNDGTFEQIDGGKLYLVGRPSTKEYEATFEIKGMLYFLTDTYKKGIYVANGTSFYDLLVNLFNEVGFEEYKIDESLKEKYTTIPLQMLPTKENIQLICNATNMIFFEDRTGKIKIVPRNTDIQSYYLDLANQTEFPKVESIPKLRDIKVAVYKPTVSTETSKIYEGNFAVAGNEVLKIDYSSSPATNAVATLTNATLNSAKYYAYYCELDVTVSNTSQPVGVIINGNAIELNKSTYTLHVNAEGEDCEIDNPLIDTESEASEVAMFFRDYLIYRNTYSTENRGEPAWDAGDTIELQTQFSEKINGIITSNEITYNGALKGKTTLKGLV